MDVIVDASHALCATCFRSHALLSCRVADPARFPLPFDACHIDCLNIPEQGILDDCTALALILA
jgi:hypothetical protein